MRPFASFVLVLFFIIGISQGACATNTKSIAKLQLHFSDTNKDILVDLKNALQITPACQTPSPTDLYIKMYRYLIRPETTLLLSIIGRGETDLLMTIVLTETPLEKNDNDEIHSLIRTKKGWEEDDMIQIEEKREILKFTKQENQWLEHCLQE